MNGRKYSLHAVIEMVDIRQLTDWPSGVVLQERACKPPKGAVVKSHGAERLGKGHAMSEVRYR